MALAYQNEGYDHDENENDQIKAKTADHANYGAINVAKPHFVDSYLYKGVGLLFMCSIGFGSYFCYDNPGALEVSNMDLRPSYVENTLYNMLSNINR